MPRRGSLATEGLLAQLNHPVGSPTCRHPWNDSVKQPGAFLELQVPAGQESASTTTATSD